MKQKTNYITRRGQSLKRIQGERPNWVLLVGGALLSTLSIRIACKLKQIFKGKQSDDGHDSFKENGKSAAKGRSTACPLHANMYYLKRDEDSCYHCLSGMPEGDLDVKRASSSPMSKDGHPSLPLVTIPATESRRENSVIWASSPERLELPPKPFQHSNSSDSPCVSECGSDVFSKREVIQKLRQQLKRRDEMIIEMQAQIADLQNSLASEIARSTNLQSQIDSANRELFDSEREIQRLRKAIADHCVAELGSTENIASAPKWYSDTNGHANGCIDRANDEELHCNGMYKGSDGGRVEMFKREVRELKEVIEGKEFLLQSYKEQKVELCAKVKELQWRVASQVPSIL